MLVPGHDSNVDLRSLVFATDCIPAITRHMERLGFEPRSASPDHWPPQENGGCTLARSGWPAIPSTAVQPMAS